MFKDNLFNVEELKREKAEYFHIGIPGLTKELEDDYRDVAIEFLSKNKDIKNGKEWLEKEEWNKRFQ